MRNLVLTQVEYEDLVYPSVAVFSASEVKDLRTVVKVLDKLEAAGEAPERKGGRFVDPNNVIYKMNGISAMFHFEDAEAEFLIERLEAFMQRIQAWQSRGLLRIIDQLKTEVEEVPSGRAERVDPGGAGTAGIQLDRPTEQAEEAEDPSSADVG